MMRIQHQYDVVKLFRVWMLHSTKAPPFTAALLKQSQETHNCPICSPTSPPSLSLRSVHLQRHYRPPLHRGYGASQILPAFAQQRHATPALVSLPPLARPGNQLSMPRAASAPASREATSRVMWLNWTSQETC